MSKKVIGEGDEYKIYFDKPDVCGNEAFIPIMNDYNSGDPIRMEKARKAACQQMERIIVKMISQKYGTYAKKYGGELKQAGFVGVLTGLDVERSKRYNPYDKFTPSAYFYKYIKHEFCEFINSLGPAKTSSHYSSSLKQVRKAIEVYVKNGEAYDETTIAQYTSISLDTVKVCFDILRAEEGTMSYNDLVNGENGEEALGLNYETPEKTIEEEARNAAVAKALDCLSKDEKYVILNRFGFEGTIKTCNAIAHDLGISETQVKKLQKKALEKLRGTSLRQWHATDGAHDGSTGTNGIFTFFPESSKDDDVQFSSLMSDFTFGEDDQTKTG